MLLDGMAFAGRYTGQPQETVCSPGRKLNRVGGEGKGGGERRRGNQSERRDGQSRREDKLKERVRGKEKRKKK